MVDLIFFEDFEYLVYVCVCFVRGKATMKSRVSMTNPRTIFLSSWVPSAIHFFMARMYMWGDV